MNISAVKSISKAVNAASLPTSTPSSHWRRSALSLISAAYLRSASRRSRCKYGQLVARNGNANSPRSWPATSRDLPLQRRRRRRHLACWTTGALQSVSLHGNHQTRPGLYTRGYDGIVDRGFQGMLLRAGAVLEFTPDKGLYGERIACKIKLGELEDHCVDSFGFQVMR